MKTRRSLKQTILEVATQNKQDDEMEEEKIVLKKEEIQSLVQEPLTYENLIMCYWMKVTLPSSLWAVHKESTGTFIAFSYLSENTSDIFVSTEKVIMFERSLKADIFVRGRKVEPSSIVQQNVETIETMDALLKEVDQFDLCKGTGLDSARYSPDCCLILDRKYRNSRCSNCAMKRTHLKKTEAQRVRRAAAKQKEPMKNIVGSRKQSKKREVEYLDDRSDIEMAGMEDFIDKQDEHFTDKRDSEKIQDQEYS